MSSRATVHFQDGDTPPITHAIIYRHCDGDLEGLGRDLRTFFKEVSHQTKDTRFDDPSYLAAKFVVWQADQYVSDGEGPLAFLSVGIVVKDPRDIKYRYFVRCSSHKTPTVMIEAIYG